MGHVPLWGRYAYMGCICLGWSLSYRLTHITSLFGQNLHNLSLAQQSVMFAVGVPRCALLSYQCHVEK